MVTLRPSLDAPELVPLWEAVRARLERSGVERRGRLRLPDMTSRARFLLGAVVGGSPLATVDLEVLERALRDLGVGDDLAGSLASIGFPVSGEPERRRAVRRSGRDARAAARSAAEDWGEPWAGEWIDGVIRAGVLAGLEPEEAVRLVSDVRSVLDRIAEGSDAPDPQSRVDLAALVLGSSHALDWGTREEAAVTRALSCQFGGTGRQAWEDAGVHLDLVSAPALTWGLRPRRCSPWTVLVGEADRLGVPLHLTQLALRKYPVELPAGADVLVAENPRVVEAAAQERSSLTVVALNGNPSGAARVLVEQLLACGASLRYHGDFDVSGLRICARMHRMGLVPWHMDSASYRDALAIADTNGARLPLDPHRSPPTPWDADLQSVFDQDRRIVHEERLLALLLQV